MNQMFLCYFYASNLQSLFDKTMNMPQLENIYNPVTEYTPCLNVLCTAQLLFSEFVLTGKLKIKFVLKNKLPALVGDLPI